MKKTQMVMDSIKPLLEVCIKQADRHGLDEIRISKARAKELLLLVNAATTTTKGAINEPAFFAHLDRRFSDRK